MAPPSGPPDSPPRQAPSRSPGRDISRTATVGAALASADHAAPTGSSPGNSPLQSLISRLKESLVPGPQHPEASPSSLPPVPAASWPTRPELGLGASPGEGVPGDLSPQAGVLRPQNSNRLSVGISLYIERLPEGSFVTRLLRDRQGHISAPRAPFRSSLILVRDFQARADPGRGARCGPGGSGRRGGGARACLEPDTCLPCRPGKASAAFEPRFPHLQGGGSPFPPEAGGSNGFACTFPKRKPCSGPRNRSLSGDPSAAAGIRSWGHTRCGAFVRHPRRSPPFCIRFWGCVDGQVLNRSVPGDPQVQISGSALF